MALVLKNNAVSRLASSLTTGSTTLQLTATEGSRFPLLAAGDWFPVTVLRSTGALEIMRCTARAGDALTVTRAQEGTSALTFDAGDRVELRLTAGAFTPFIEQMQAAIDAIQTGPIVRAANFIDKTTTNEETSGTVTLDLSQADVFNLTLSGATTLAISNAPALSGETFAFVVSVTQPATAYSLAWFAGVTWRTPNGAAPAAPAAGKSAEYVFSTTDGANFIGRTGAAN